MSSVDAILEPLAGSRLPALIVGERGAGHEAIARKLHTASGAPGAFVTHDGSTVEDVDTLVESAKAGTLLIREVADLPARAQCRLSELLEHGCAARIVGSTSRDLRAAVTRGTLLADLYYRLAAVKLQVPSLRERRGELPDLIRDAIRTAANGRGAPTLSDEAMAELLAHSWPGNLGELDDVAAALVQAPEPSAALIRSLLEDDQSAPVAPLRTLTLAEIVDGAISAAVDRSGGDVKRAARALGVSRATVYRRTRANRGDSV